METISDEVKAMYLTVQNQLHLLYDLLREHQKKEAVSNQDYIHIKKLVQSIIAEEKVNDELLGILPEIYYYSIKGEHACSLYTHIEDYEQKINNWLLLIQEVKFNLSS